MASHGRRRERDSLSLIVALVLHAGAMLAVRHWVKQHPMAASPRVAITDPTILWGLAEEVDLEASPAPPVDAALDPPAQGELGMGKRATQPGVRRAPAVQPATPIEKTPEASPEPVALAELEPAPSPSVAPAGREGPIDLGLGPDGWQRWVGVLPNEPRAPRTEARGRPVVRAPPVSSTGGLQEGLEASDRKLGMGPSGRVATALFQAAHAPDAPETGSALFNVTVLRTGAVEVTLGETTDRRWQAVATHAAEALRQAPPRIPPPREGYRLTLRITAEETMPNGLRRKQLHGARLEVEPLRFRDQRAAEREVELKNPVVGVGPDQQDFRGSPIVMDLPGVYVTGVGRVCSYRFGISVTGLLLQGGCDLANAGAKLQRIVRTEVREQSAF
ncbi:MAG TPA: hypothetical protein VFV94_03730 [Polyangiaceae bacterium]|nr:hypothetical protein [Polyangiaceae bacterium]